jgi:hypothetical protein
MRIGARWWRVRVEPDLPAELRRGSRSLGKATAKADPFVSHFLVVLLQQPPQRQSHGRRQIAPPGREPHVRPIACSVEIW